MSEDATLDAFAESDAESTDGVTPSDGAATRGDDADVEEASDAPDRIPVTSSWAATASCPDCGDEVARLWRDGDASVCAACKSWRSSGEGPCDR